MKVLDSITFIKLKIANNEKITLNDNRKFYANFEP